MMGVLVIMDSETEVLNGNKVIFFVSNQLFISKVTHLENQWVKIRY